MRRVLLPLFIGILFLTLQATLLTSAPVRRIRPDLILILTLYWGLSSPLISGGILAFLLGFLIDLFSGNAFGIYTFSRPLLFFLAHLFKGRFYLENFPSQFLFAFLFALLEGLLILTLLSGLNPEPVGNLYPSMLTFLVPQSLTTGLTTPIVFYFLQKASSLPLGRHGVMKERG